MPSTSAPRVAYILQADDGGGRVAQGSQNISRSTNANRALLPASDAAVLIALRLCVNSIKWAAPKWTVATVWGAFPILERQS